MADTFIDRLTKEYEELNEKFEKLEAFLETDKFHNLEALQRRLLIDQHGAMHEYLNCLATRITTNRKVEKEFTKEELIEIEKDFGLGGVPKDL